MKKLYALILALWLVFPITSYADTVVVGGGGSFAVTDITGQTDDTTPATTATAVLAQGGALIESTLAEIGTAIIDADLATIAALTCTENQIIKMNGAGAWVCAADADSAGTPTVITVADTADATSFVALFTDATGDLGPKTDLGLTYAADTGILTATGFAGPINGTIGAGTPAAGTFTSVTVSPSATPTMTFSDSDNAAGTAYIYGNSSGGTNAIVMSLGVEIADGTENTNFLQLNGASTGSIDILKPILLSSTTQLQFGDTGTYINQSADGVLNVASDTELKLLINDEDLKFTKTGTNGITLGTNTGVTTVTTALNLVSTGTIQGGVVISSDADGMDAAAMTAAGVRGTMFIATGAGTWILPRAVLGDSLCLMDSGTAHDLILDVTAGSTIRLKGTEQADGVGITNASGSTTGDLICVIAVATDKWSTVGMQGTWASQ